MSTIIEASIFEEKLRSLREQTKALFRQQTTHVRTLRSYLWMYRRVIGSNYLHWVLNVQERCRSTSAEHYCTSVLLREGSHSYPRSLERFITQAGEASTWMQSPFRASHLLTEITAATQSSSLEGLLVLAGLEYASSELILEFKRWANILQCSDRTFLEEWTTSNTRRLSDVVVALEEEVRCLNKNSSFLTNSSSLFHVNALISNIFS